MSGAKLRRRPLYSAHLICAPRVVAFGAAVVLALCAVGVAEGADEVLIAPRASQSQTSGKPQESIRLDVKAVLVPVTVTDQRNRPIQDLKKEDFRLFEDAVQQDISTLAWEDAPTSIGVIFDASNSMTKKIAASVNAMDQFFQTSLPGDEFLLIRFSDRPDCVSGFTSDIDDISAWLHATRAHGWTALNDAIYMGIEKMKGARNNRRALLVLSDGGDNNSRYSKSELLALVREADVRIYSISFYQGSHLLESISEETGGGLIQVRSSAEVAGAVGKLSREIHSQYVLSYYSNHPQNDGKYHRVRVSTVDPALRVSWRHGYYSPSF